MKYMLIMSTPRDGYDQFMKWPKKLLEANFAFMESFSKRLAEAGELVSADGLAAPTEAILVRAGKGGKPITDGVFPESKEYLAGFWIVDVESRDRALQIAAEAATAPGQAVKRADGATIDHLWIEVRQLLGSHKEL